LNIVISNTEVELLAEKAIFLPCDRTLVIADLHLGKVEHFRKNGFAIPAAAGDETLIVLAELILKYAPCKVVFLGDLFHSQHNSAVDKLADLIAGSDQIQYILVMGNHDIMSNKTYLNLGLTTVTELVIDNILFTHEPLQKASNYYNIAGHIHPGVQLRGGGKQKMSLPCFYFDQKSGILPAFGHFTGKYLLKIKNNSRVFAVGDGQVFDIATQ